MCVCIYKRERKRERVSVYENMHQVYVYILNHCSQGLHGMTVSIRSLFVYACTNVL